MKALLILSLLGVTFGCMSNMGTGPDRGPGPNTGPDPSPSQSMPKHEKPFIFGVESGWPPYAYTDENTGQGIGFLLDAVREVCRVAGRKCDIMFAMSTLENCYNPEDQSGTGLNDRHYDACVGWTATAQRWNVFNFSSPMLDIIPAQIYVKSDSDLTADTLEGKKIGFRKYWYMDQFCMRHSGVDIDDEQVEEIEAVAGWEDVVAALDDGKVDAVVLPDNHEVAREKGLKSLITAVDCSYGGATGLMHRKDVDTKWFGESLQEMKDGFAYSDLCKKWQVPNCCQ